MNNLQIINGHPVIELLSVDSSNNYAASLLNNGNPTEGTVILSHFQSEGRGQRGTSWSAKPGQNLTFSIITYPNFVKPDQAFLLTQISALAICQALDNLVKGPVEIKWPNDIMINGVKVAGILIENSLVRKTIDSSIIGIGLNVNQSEFEGIRATSLANIKGANLGLIDCLATILEAFDNVYRRGQKGDLDEIQKEYHSRLFRLNKEYPFRIKGDKQPATIQHVDEHGNLVLHTASGNVTAGIKEIEFLF